MNKTTSSYSPGPGVLQGYASMTLLHHRLILSEEEIDEICKGLKSNYAKVRALRRLKFKVYRKPDGSPLVFRIDLLNRFLQPDEAPLELNGSKCEPKWLKRN